MWRMFFVGIDLAWAGRNPTGVAVLDPDGRLVRVGAARAHRRPADITSYGDFATGCIVTPSLPCGLSHP